jgi:hypothetical protein
MDTWDSSTEPGQSTDSFGIDVGGLQDGVVIEVKA